MEAVRRITLQWNSDSGGRGCLNYRCIIVVKSREWWKRIVIDFASKCSHVDVVPRIFGIIASECL